MHHLGLSPWALQHFAGQRKSRRKRGLFAAPYNRPSLQLFNAHCDRIVETFDLAALHVRDRARSCAVSCDHVVVRLGSGDELEAQNVVLAIGMSEQPHWPAWAPREHPRVHHVFQSGFDGWPAHGRVGEVETVAVVGGGIQVTQRLVKEGHRVHFISRHALREHQLDSSPGWLGPGGAFLDELITTAGLPCARCGYPVVDEVSGPLAELELGPTSRNIAGRRTGERLMAALSRR